MAKIFGQLEKAQLENTTSDTANLPKGTATYRTDLNLPKVSNGTTMKTLVDADTAQTLSNKTMDNTTVLQSPAVTGAITLQEIATPTTPSSGNGKIYFKSDGKLYQLDDAGVEKTLVDTTTTQTLSNKTMDNTTILQSPSATGALTLQEIATPATPSTGNGKIYFKSDGRLYQLDDAGTESIIAASAYVGLIVNTSSTTISSALADIKFTNVVEDTHSAYNTSTGEWTCPVTGRYMFTGAIFSSGTFALDTRVNCMIVVNGTNAAAALSRAGGAVTNLGSGVAVAVRNVTAGQIVKFQGASQAGTPAIVADTTLTYFNITKVGI
jgi:predicted heme/steroid binding protein